LHARTAAGSSPAALTQAMTEGGTEQLLPVPM
jgi:hypothetical protein